MAQCSINLDSERRLIHQGMKMIYWQPKMELMERNELEELQLRRLKSIAEKVYKHVPFYHNRFKEAEAIIQRLKELQEAGEFAPEETPIDCFVVAEKLECVRMLMRAQFDAFFDRIKGKRFISAIRLFEQGISHLIQERKYDEALVGLKCGLLKCPREDHDIVRALFYSLVYKLFREEQFEKAKEAIQVGRTLNLLKIEGVV